MTQSMPESNVGELVEEYRPRLRAFIRKRVANEEDAEDILQDVFYQLARTVESSLNPIEQVSAWLYRVARNMIINKSVKKREVALPTFRDDDSDDDIQRDFSEVLFGGFSAAPDDEYLRSLVWIELGNALAELPDEQREIFELTEFDGVPVKDIASLTGVAVNTLLSRKHYAVKHLRKRLAGLYEDLIYG